MRSAWLIAAGGVKAQHIPFKGAVEALTEIMTGRVDFYFVPLPPARGLIAPGQEGDGAGGVEREK